MSKSVDYLGELRDMARAMRERQGFFERTATQAKDGAESRISRAMENMGKQAASDAQLVEAYCERWERVQELEEAKEAIAAREKDFAKRQERIDQLRFFATTNRRSAAAMHAASGRELAIASAEHTLKTADELQEQLDRDKAAAKRTNYDGVDHDLVCQEPRARDAREKAIEGLNALKAFFERQV